MAGVEIDEDAVALVADDDIGAAVTVEIAGGGGTSGAARPSEFRGLEVSFAVVPEDDASAAVAMGNEEVDCAIAIEVGGDDGGGGFGAGEGAALGEAALAIVPADEAGRELLGIVAAVGDDDVGTAVAVEIGKSDVAGGPMRLAVGAGDGEAAVAVVAVDELAVGLVVADDDVEVAVAIEVGESGGVGAVGGRGNRRRVTGRAIRRSRRGRTSPWRGRRCRARGRGAF